jgi:very-short-patch-repair endonuclease
LTVDDYRLSRRQEARVRPALALADVRSESPLETVVRLLLTRAGLPPEILQLRLFTHHGVCYARLDLAWPSCRLAIEADGRETHDKPEALYQDRVRQNNLVLAGWTVLRFTWFDVLRRPSWVVAQVATALQKLRLTHA